jgi:SM-20-related protein
MSDHLEIEGVLDRQLLERLRTEMRQGPAEVATVLGDAGRTVLPTVRQSDRIEVAAATRDAVLRILEDQRPRLEAHFGRQLGGGLEPPQFLRYGPGHFFVPHQDGNTPLIHDRTRFFKVSVVLFVTDAGDHAGGDFVLHGEPPAVIAPAAGKLLAFTSETTHEVTPITEGERLSVACWYRAPG